jgi:symplekin
MWMLLMARLSTRGAERKNAIVNFVTTDFASRSKFASIWLNEEWYNDKLNHTSVYPSHLAAIMASLLPKVDAKDRSLSPFLSSLPELPITVIDSLASLCGDADKAIVGFLALRDLIEARPPVRKEALGGLLELCTHPDRKTRVMAIRTVSRWVPDSPMSSQITSYGLGVLRRLVTESKPQDSDVEMEDGEQVEEKVESKFLTEVTTDTVQQHVELAFALSRRHQDMLEDIFSVYPKLETAIAGPVKTLLTPLIQSLGPTPRLLEVLRHFPAGADELALHVVTTLSAEGASTVVANLVKGLMSERELEPRFIIPIIGELDKVGASRSAAVGRCYDLGTGS